MRYLPLTTTIARDMLARIGVPNDRRAVSPTCPTASCLAEPARSARRTRARSRSSALSEHGGAEVAAGSVPFFVGAGAYRHHVPAAVDHLIQRSEFLTSYTPYQPEIAQGTLQYLFEFQTQVALLTGMEVANASMYDGSTATAEAVLMAHRVTSARKAVLSGGLHPHYAETVRDAVAHGRRHAVAALAAGCQRAKISWRADRRETRPASSSRTPDVFGNLRDLRRIAEACSRQGRAADRRVHRSRVARADRSRPARWAPTSSSAKASRSAMALNFGGPYVGLFATPREIRAPDAGPARAARRWMPRAAAASC